MREQISAWWPKNVLHFWQWQQASLNPCAKRVAQACRFDSRSWCKLVVTFSSLCSNGRCRLMCMCVTCYWLNRRVLRNIEAEKCYMQPETYKHSPRRGTLSWSMWGSLRLTPKIAWFTENRWRIMTKLTHLKYRSTRIWQPQSQVWNSVGETCMLWLYMYVYL